MFKVKEIFKYCLPLLIVLCMAAAYNLSGTFTGYFYGNGAGLNSLSATNLVDLGTVITNYVSVIQGTNSSVALPFVAMNVSGGQTNYNASFNGGAMQNLQSTNTVYPMSIIAGNGIVTFNNSYAICPTNASFTFGAPIIPSFSSFWKETIIVSNYLGSSINLTAPANCTFQGTWTCNHKTKVEFTYDGTTNAVSTPLY
jgi:hypothetical protein